MIDETKKTNLSRTAVIVSGVVFLILLTGIGVYAFQSMNETGTNMSSSQSQIAVTDNNEMKSDESMMKNDASVSSTSSMENNSSVSSENTMSKPGEYLPYSADLVSTKASTGNVVLFFNASWCSTCKNTIKDINSKLDKIPSNLTILSADYDKEIALRQKYGITMQHTFVKVDKDGNLIKTMPSLSTLEDITAFAKSN